MEASSEGTPIWLRSHKKDREQGKFGDPLKETRIKSREKEAGRQTGELGPGPTYRAVC